METAQPRPNLPVESCITAKAKIGEHLLMFSLRDLFLVAEAVRRLIEMEHETMMKAASCTAGCARWLRSVVQVQLIVGCAANFRELLCSCIEADFCTFFQALQH